MGVEKDARNLMGNGVKQQRCHGNGNNDGSECAASHRRTTSADQW